MFLLIFLVFFPSLLFPFPFVYFVLSALFYLEITCCPHLSLSLLFLSYSRSISFHLLHFRTRGLIYADIKYEESERFLFHSPNSTSDDFSVIDCFIHKSGRNIPLRQAPCVHKSLLCTMYSEDFTLFRAADSLQLKCFLPPHIRNNPQFHLSVAVHWFHILIG